MQGMASQRCNNEMDASLLSRRESAIVRLSKSTTSEKERHHEDYDLRH
jgi:hypothetical protein